MKLDATDIRYIGNDEFRVLTATEMGSKNHEVVPTSLIAQISGLRNGGVNKILGSLARRNLVARVQNASYDGYRLTYGGYDYLALRTLSKRDSVLSVGNQIGVGKESDIYIVADGEGKEMVLKIHRLGRTSFRAIKSKRDYLGKRKSASWMYMSRLSAQREWAFMKISSVPHPGKLYSSLMDLIVRFARAGLIHGDFNEFNILIHRVTSEPIVIDFPQMVSTSHANAEFYFNRDVECIRTFFKRRFNYESNLYPRFQKTVDSKDGADGEGFRLDVVVSASGFKKQDLEALEEYMETAREHADNARTQDSDDDEEDSSDEDPEDEELVEESESNEEDDAPGTFDERRSESGDQPGQTAPQKDKSPELAEQVEGLHLTSSAADPKPEPEADLVPEIPGLDSLPTGKEVLRHLVSNELTRQQAKQKVKYHSKKSGAGRTRGSKAKQDTRVKVSDHWAAMRSFLSRYNSSQPGQPASAQQSGQPQDMGWRSLAVGLGSTVKRAAKSAYEGGYERIVTIRDSETIKGWRERRNEEVKGLEKVTLFPGYATKRFHGNPTRQNEFAIDIFVDGYASSLRPPELASRSQKAFMRLAKGFAALPKLPVSDHVAGGAMVPDVDDAQSVRSLKDDESYNSDAEDIPELSGHLPPRPDQMDDRLEEAVLAHDPRAMNTHPGSLNARAQDIPSPQQSLENIGHAELAILHANLDARLQPFWSSILPNRTVRISIFVSEHQTPNEQQSTTRNSDSDDLKPVPLAVAEVQTNPQGYFSQRFNIPFDEICTYPLALPIAFGDPYVEHYLVIQADLLPVESPALVRPPSYPLDARPPSPAVSVRSTRSDRMPQPERLLELPSSTSASFSAPATPPHPYQQPSASVSQTSIRPPPSVQLRIPITSARVRLISDIDDTIKRTDVLLGVKAIYRNVFVKGLSDLIVPGMADWYSAMAGRGVRFHYVSNSPFELLPVLQEFFEIAGIPHGSVRLRYYGGRSMLGGLWSGAGERKRTGIVEVLDIFADSQFILVGDTGEQDLELYAAIARERPEQILGLFLRDVSTTGPPVDVPDPIRDIERLEQSSEHEAAYFSPTTPTPSRPPTLPHRVRDIPPPPVRNMSARPGSMDSSSTAYGSAQVPYRPRTPSRKSTANHEGVPSPSPSPVTRPVLSSAYTSEPQEARTPSPYAVQTRTSPTDPRTPSQRLPGAYGQTRPTPTHRSSTSMSSAQDAYDIEEKRRNDLRVRVETARQLTPAHIILKIFREPAECDEVFKLLDSLGLKEKPRP
ncbi:hypothetical protein FRC05_006595 [Tulasnella sp. 425]|nr:hypothetical protein FRC05_006595 [Tulasnella sp. 425]